ncbi:MAG: GNAT family N-acetyltransferase [Solobacterium sp.]|nr:GNAT family N-acetyltransferase [Solobacterium sp.]
MVIQVSTEQDLEKCVELHRAVFRDEEHGPEALWIIDETDRSPRTRNYLCIRNGSAVGTCRITETDADTVKLQRLVVLSGERGRGYGAELLAEAEKAAVSSGCCRIVMDAAEKSAGFYERYGYERKSGVFFEDGRPHIRMEKELKHD